MSLHFKWKNYFKQKLQIEGSISYFMNFMCPEAFFKIKVRNFNFGVAFLVKNTLYSIRNRRAKFFSDTDLPPIKHGLTSLTPVIMNTIAS